MKKTLKKGQRLSLAKKWIKTYTGKHLVKGYSKHFCVDKICAVRELRMIGVEISQEYENQLLKSLEKLRQQRSIKKKQKEHELNTLAGVDSDEYFAFIAGYTSGGFAYGLTHEEMEEIERDNESE